jgi:hypothetical protein
MDPDQPQRLQATITFVVDFDATPTTGSADPVALAKSCRLELGRDPFVYFSPAELRSGHSQDPTVHIERHVEVEAAPVDELAPEQIGMRIAPRRPGGWAGYELATFLDKWVKFDTVDRGQMVAKVASIGGWSAEVAIARAQHQLGHGPAVSLWVPALARFVWANPDSLAIIPAPAVVDPRR